MTDVTSPDHKLARVAMTDRVLAEMIALRQAILESVQHASPLFETIHPHYKASARNLLHYLALRRRDLRHLQTQLSSLGLSSLGRAESHVLATVDAVMRALHCLSDGACELPRREPMYVDFADGQRLLTEHTQQLLGNAPSGRSTRIMVTMPSEAADDYTLVHQLLLEGMDCMRINCAHDDTEAWSKMIAHLRKAEAATGRRCKVVMDLGGPKLRTGPLEPGPAVLKIRPERNEIGQTIAPARIWLTSHQSPSAAPSPATATLQVDAAWLKEIRPGEEVRVVDARGSRRILKIVDVAHRGCWAEANRTLYLIPDTRLKRKGVDPTTVKNLPVTENFLQLKSGDTLIVTRDQLPGRPATFDSRNQLLTPATIGCSLPEVFNDVASGESIWFDDGKIGGIIEKVESDRIRVRITQARPRGEKLRADKGINLPDSDLKLPSLTPQDLEDLRFVVEHADIVDLSFANTAYDVEQLFEQMARLSKRAPAVVLKIETQRGFDNLPQMLLAAMRGPCCGVMIARGDLAIECGFQRMAEVQEEILWICEAAHIPVIWATQVLETLAKEGIPSRAEITDAAMGHRAECVMLNKGPHILSAVRVLDDILRRMQAHQSKKRAMMRALRVADRPMMPTREN